MEEYLWLFVSAFLAATLLPLSSEVFLIGLMATENYNSAVLWTMASLGNVAGSCINWTIGRFCLNWKGRRWFPISQDRLNTARKWFIRYGVWSLLLAWLPVIGDPLTFIAGIMRVKFHTFLTLVTIGKAGRYGVLILIADDILKI